MLELLTPELETYCLDHTSPDSPVCQEIVDYTTANEEYSGMLSGPLVGAFLQQMVRATRARRILEIGAFTGYSAIKMAEAMADGGEVHTLEIDGDRAIKIREFAQKGGWGKQVTVHTGPALDTLKLLKGPFDLAFIDADKENYPAYYLAAKSMMGSGGVIILDNALWSGGVLDPQDDATRAIAKVNDLIAHDPDVTNMLLPVRDGLMVATIL